MTAGRKRVLCLALAFAMTLFVFLLGTTSASTGDVVISTNTTITNETITGNLYIPQGYTVDLTGTVSVNGSVYVWGTLNNHATLTVSGTLNCLHYGSMMSAGNYNCGYFYNYAHATINALNVTDGWISTHIPGASNTATVAPLTTPTPTAAQTTGDVVITSNTTISNQTITGNVYIPRGYTVNLTGTVRVNGNVYVWGTLKNYASFTVTDTLYCLHYGSMMSAGDYDCGYFYNYASTNIDTLNVTAGWISTPIPGATNTATVTPTNTPSPTMPSGSWNYSNGVLTITGTGDMADYSFTNPWASYKNSITSVVIQPGVTRIGECAFYNLTKLERVSIPNTVKSIGVWAFSGCSKLNNVKIPSGVTKIESWAFRQCSGLTSITIPGTVNNLGLDVFAESANVTAHIKYTNTYAINYCISNGVSYRASCQNEHTVFSTTTENVVEATCVEAGAFDEVKYCNVCETEISREAKAIAAKGHTVVTEARVEATCTAAGVTEGSHCSVCNEVLVAQTAIPATGHAIALTQTLFETQVGGDAVAVYAETLCGHEIDDGLNWTVSVGDRLAYIEDADESETGRYGAIFEPRSAGLATVFAVTDDEYQRTSESCSVIVHSDAQAVLPSNLNAIEAKAFEGSGAEEYVLPDGVSSIGSKAFADCGGLMLINLPDSLTSIADDAFDGCGTLTILCSSGSLGHTYAETQDIPYVIR